MIFSTGNRDTKVVLICLCSGLFIFGYLVTRVLDIMENGMQIAIVDTSASCHMPDVLEMPYRPNIIGTGEPCQYLYTYRLGGLTFLA